VLAVATAPSQGCHSFLPICCLISVRLRPDELYLQKPERCRVIVWPASQHASKFLLSQILDFFVGSTTNKGVITAPEGLSDKTTPKESLSDNGILMSVFPDNYAGLTAEMLLELYVLP